MKLIKIVDNISEDFSNIAIRMAEDNAKDLSAMHLKDDDPFLPLAQAEVKIRLTFALNEINKPFNVEGIKSRSHIIFALDDTIPSEPVAGFITYKPRFPDFTSASIGYIVVDKSYRGRGVMRLMMETLLEEIPAVGLDCPIHLVSLYKKFGFHVRGVQGCHIAMNTASLNGQMVVVDDETIQQRPEMRFAKRNISKALGEKSDEGYSEINKQNSEQKKKAEHFVSNELK
ncbi:GNAT family N-acetyltransferase [Acetobacter pasteurianus]|uniref:GNAT family N-acetyltransferase n=1 Tax=Acetobacter pasteurianus TaxID=438 RepID=UPI00130E7506|nr:GNAT family N-acetyltransferase [Acetobacter pasteurianus]